MSTSKKLKSEQLFVRVETVMHASSLNVLYFTARFYLPS